MKDDFLEQHRRNCPVCGKEFYASAEWVYRRGYDSKGLRWFCSWKCLRRDEKEHMSIADRINQAIRDGMRDEDIKRELGVTQRQIDYRSERGNNK